jgi:hypothetical protein
MGLSNLLGILQNYAGGASSAPAANAKQDFQNVSQNIPQQHLASGLATAFQSDQTPPFPEMLAHLFSNSNGQQRAGILNELLGAVGGGAGAGLPQELMSVLGGSSQITPQQAQQVSPSVLQQLANRAQSADPGIVQKASNFYSQHPDVISALGGGALALILSHVSTRL